MKALFGLLVMLAAVSHGMETPCDATLDGARCYGTLGGTVFLQLMTIVGGVPDISLKTESNDAAKIILKIRNKHPKIVKIHKSIETRAHFFINNGTLRIDNTERNDSAEYRLETFNADGKTLGTRKLQLFIEAPVSSPQLSSQCLTHGEMRVSCSSEGDGPQYSWTLDGHPLRDTEASPGDKTNTITLKRGQSGDLTCTVKNNINSVTVSKIISPCEEIIGMVAASLAGVVLVLVMVLAVYCVQKKKKPPKTSVHVDSQDVEYANVRTLKKQMRLQERKVEYGQVKITGAPQQPLEVFGQNKTLEGPRWKVCTPEEGDCVYARVRKGQ
nr:hepatocyte cell adhesion molecule-like isoform X2 [Oncorhynchus nerka]